jgi:DNA-binding LytR/AlgR family response regulator
MIYRNAFFGKLFFGLRRIIYVIGGIKRLIHIAICDDEPIFLKLFQNILKEQLKILNIEYAITCYSNGWEFLKEIVCFDAVFLDIDMPEMNGMEVAMYVNQKHPIPILFLTSHDELVYSSIQFQPFRFIRKDYIDSELEEAVRALNEHIRIQSQNHSVYLHTSKGYIMISIKDIQYAEIYDHLIKIHTTEDEVYKCYGKLSDYEKQWERFGFIRTHKSYLVNGWYIYSIRENTVILDGGKEILLSRRRATAVREKFEYLMRSV